VTVNRVEFLKLRSRTQIPILSTRDGWHFETEQKGMQQFIMVKSSVVQVMKLYRGADKFLARPGRKQATATEYFDFHMSYL
jgi:hypothetical protein